MVQVKFVMEEGPIRDITYEGFSEIRMYSVRPVNFHVVIAEDDEPERIIMSTNQDVQIKNRVDKVPNVLRDALKKMFMTDNKKESVWMTVEVLLVFSIDYKKYLKS